MSDRIQSTPEWFVWQDDDWACDYRVLICSKLQDRDYQPWRKHGGWALPPMEKIEPFAERSFPIGLTQVDQVVRADGSDVLRYRRGRNGSSVDISRQLIHLLAGLELRQTTAKTGPIVGLDPETGRRLIYCSSVNPE